MIESYKLFQLDGNEPQPGYHICYAEWKAIQYTWLFVSYAPVLEGSDGLLRVQHGEAEAMTVALGFERTALHVIDCETTMSGKRTSDGDGLLGELLVTGANTPEKVIAWCQERGGLCCHLVDEYGPMLAGKTRMSLSPSEMDLIRLALQACDNRPERLPATVFPASVKALLARFTCNTEDSESEAK